MKQKLYKAMAAALVVGTCLAPSIMAQAAAVRLSEVMASSKAAKV